MFTKAELNHLDCDYFFVMLRSACRIQLKSKNTGHIWDLESNTVFYGKRSIIVHHKHKDTDCFHVQRGIHPKTIAEAQNMIKSHDEWHLNGRA